jgi:hypothetical protein
MEGDAMAFVAGYADWIMIVSGLITATMIHAALRPKAALQSMFGESLDGPLAEIVVRNWGALIALVGAALIYGGATSTLQGPILVAAGASKLVFIGLVLAYGRKYLTGMAGISVAIDAVFVLLYAIILLSS